MSRIYLVRHGQASFGAPDYDQLTPTGIRQCEALASHWREIGRDVDLVFAGTLRRQRESAEVFVRATEAAGGLASAVLPLPGVEEYDHRALLAAFDGGQPKPESADRRAFQNRLTGSLDAWVRGGLEGVESFTAFRERCGSALSALLAAIGRGREAVLFASAGSLAAAMQPALGIGDHELMRFKLRFYNTGVSCLLFNGETLTIESVNSISHLEQRERLALITHR